MLAFGCRPLWIISEKKETQPSHTIFPVKSQKVVASIFKVWTGLTCEGSSCRVWVIDRWQKLEIDQSIFLFFKVLIVPLQTPWDGCYMKQILSKGLPWEGSTYLIRWSTIKTPPSFKMNQKHQSPWTVLAHILKTQQSQKYHQLILLIISQFQGSRCRSRRLIIDSSSPLVKAARTVFLYCLMLVFANRKLVKYNLQLSNKEKKAHLWEGYSCRSM